MQQVGGRLSNNAAGSVPAQGGRISVRDSWRLLHPLPSLMTAAASGAFVLLAAGGVPPVGTLLILLAVEICRQFSISAVNDYFDRYSDAGRPDKPVAGGRITPASALATGAVFGGASLLLALPFGAWFFLLTAVGLGGGLLYDAGLKNTAFSWLPFSIAFPTLPLWAWVGVHPAGELPPRLLWALPVAAVLVLGIHLADTIPDLAAGNDDGVLGLAHRLGLTRSLALCWAAFAAGLLLTLALWPFLPYRLEWYLPGLLMSAASMLAALLTYLSDRSRLKQMSLLLEVGALALAVGWVGAILL